VEKLKYCKDGNGGVLLFVNTRNTFRDKMFKEFFCFVQIPSMLAREGRAELEGCFV